MTLCRGDNFISVNAMTVCARDNIVSAFADATLSEGQSHFGKCDGRLRKVIYLHRSRDSRFAQKNSPHFAGGRCILLGFQTMVSHRESIIDARQMMVSHL